MNRGFRKIVAVMLAYLVLTFPVCAADGDGLAALKKFVLGLNDASAEDYSADGLVNAVDIALSKRGLLNATALRKIRVADAYALQDAIKNAMPGDEIVLASGEYQWSTGGAKGSLFHGSTDGTAEYPIVLKSENPDNPAILSGTDTASGYVLYITGDYWKIEDIAVTGAQKGIVLDNSDYSEITRCQVYNIGDEGIHLRDGSSYCTVFKCMVSDTGKYQQGYGEAIYIGSAQSTSGYAYDCDYNTVSHCILGGGVTAELVDVKEYTTGNIVEYCELYGGGISGQVSANAFIKVKGNDCLIRGNVCYDEGNSIIRNAFENHVIVEGWGYNNRFIANTVSLTNESAYVLRVYSGSASESDSIRIPDGRIYYTWN